MMTSLSYLRTQARDTLCGMCTTWPADAQSGGVGGGVCGGAGAAIGDGGGWNAAADARRGVVEHCLRLLVPLASAETARGLRNGASSCEVEWVRAEGALYLLMAVAEVRSQPPVFLPSSWRGEGGTRRLARATDTRRRHASLARVVDTHCRHALRTRVSDSCQ